MGIFHLIWVVIVGLVVGAIAHVLVPGVRPMAWYVTAFIGIAGSFVGGFIASLISRPSEGSHFHAAGLIMSIVGAVILMFAVKSFAQ